ncbi:probable CCR4-associated factor 1 homolog 11 [Asparagus officinalis]|uniref:probable CCR4-associated factor 1 homolog 11 n=1 Tax=Asparagus officinalis TaxID=4686 RepID=UPI00098E17BB|nr:probable CCR4-associated factor 1 homolog 11 [Asparagus officinalis]
MKEERDPGKKQPLVFDGVRDVYANNVHQELELMSALRKSFNFVIIDTEFPGFLRSTPRGASEEEIYSALKYNVDNMKLVQLGITLSNGKISLAWQFNLKDFDHEADNRSEDSIELLKRSGIDFDKNRKYGISADVLSIGLTEKLIAGCEGLKWITFHGLYDLAYLIKLVYKMPLPETLAGFLGLVRILFGPMVYDVKYMAKRCSAYFAEVGLVKLSKMLGINWRGKPHQAGHDSLLTAKVFWEMMNKFDGFKEDEHAGILYGFEENARKELENHRKLVKSHMSSL